MTELGSYGVPLATARRLPNQLVDYETGEYYCVLADLHGDLPLEWMIKPGMVLEECPECGSAHIDHEDDTQFCRACAAHWPYNQPDRAFYPGAPFGGDGQ